MRKMFVSLCIVSIVVLCPLLTISHAQTFSITNGSTGEAVAPLEKNESAVDYYDYNPDPVSSGFPDFGTVSNVGFFWLYKDTNTGNISLGMIFNTRNGEEFGDVDMTLIGVPASASVELSDDISELESVNDGNWSWGACCTDGGVIGPLVGDWEIRIELDATHVSQWYFLSGPDPTTPTEIQLDMTGQLIIRTGPAPEDLEQRVSDLESQVETLMEQLIGHTHEYLTGKGAGHNNEPATTGTQIPSDE